MTETRPHEHRPATTVTYRDATELDTAGVAALHADSWRSHYRGAYPDSYLDGDLVADRMAVWTTRLAPPRSRQCTVIAESGGDVIGFAHTVFDEDPTWGSLLDNLHVRSHLIGAGIGTRLFSETAVRLLCHQPAAPLHLWVLGQNTAAQAFYEARAGTLVESRVRGTVPGSPAVTVHRYFWPDASTLVLPDT